MSQIKKIIGIELQNITNHLFIHEVHSVLVTYGKSPELLQI